MKFIANYTVQVEEGVPSIRYFAFSPSGAMFKGNAKIPVAGIIDDTEAQIQTKVRNGIKNKLENIHGQTVDSVTLM